MREREGTREEQRPESGVVGKGVVVSSPAPNVSFKYYLADRRASTGRLRAAEISLDVSLTLAHPVRKVWPIFADFNLWQGRFGFVWDGIPASNEDKFIYLSNTPGANNLNYDLDGARTEYIVRKVVPESLIYFDSLPAAVDGKDCVWTGHNVMSLNEEHGRTRIAIFMEHTWYSETMSIEELRAEAKGVLDTGLDFWRDYFIPDLIAALESSARSASTT
jgi:hypothetical protein